MKYTLWVICFLTLQSMLGLAQTDYYVSSAGDNSTGLSWINAYTDLQTALAATTSGDRIFVAAGTYYPSEQFRINGEIVVTGEPRRGVFRIPEGVEVYGGFAGNESPITQPVLDARDFITNKTTLSGDFNNDDVISGTGSSLSITSNTENAYHILYGKGISVATVLDGFTVSGGNSNDTGGPDTFGGAWYLSGNPGDLARPTVRNCIFSGNSAISLGGAIYMTGPDANPSFSACTFINNLTTGSGIGGAVFASGANFSFTDCTFESNYSPTEAGAVSIGNSNNSQSFTNCTFTGNAAGSRGGAIYNLGQLNGASNVTYTNCSFWNNSTNNQGGAIYNYGDGGGVNPTLNNCTFGGNSATNNGAAIFSDARTFTQNFGSFSITFTGSSRPNLRNCVFWGNTTNVGVSSWLNSRLANTRATYTLIEENSLPAGSTDNGNNITGATDPFNDLAAGDLTLAAGSVAIDAGDNTLVPSGVMTDAAGNPRIQDNGGGNIVDLGAFEFSVPLPEVSISISASSSLEDKGASFVFTFDRSVVSASSLTVSFSLSGTATFNDDYFLISGSNDFNATTGEGTVIIPSGQASTTLVFQVQSDAVNENDETIVVQVEP